MELGYLHLIKYRKGEYRQYIRTIPFTMTSIFYPEERSSKFLLDGSYYYQNTRRQSQINLQSHSLENLDFQTNL